MKPMLRIVLLVMAAGLVAGCSTPSTRIEHHRALFASLAPADQELIKQGKVAVGFTPDMVKLALGDPDRIFLRTDAAGVGETWVYTTWGSHEGTLMYYRGLYHRWYPGLYPYWMDCDDREEIEQFKIAFRDGKVAVVEEMTHF